MSEEKQYDATPSRMERAKREGDIARTQELGNVVAFAAALIGVAAILSPLASAVQAALYAAAAARSESAQLVQAAVFACVPIMCAAGAAIAANVLQSGGLRFAALSFKAERLAPGENLKRMFSRESVVTASRATIAFLCAAAAIVPAFIAVYSAALHSGGLGGLAGAAWNGALHTAITACVVGGVFAGADYGIQLVRWRKRLRMSHEEVKRDQKESDGDPLARSRRRAMHRQIARGSLRRVKDAAFIVTNPTHIAIALEYHPPEIPVPRVLVRAADEAAARVRELARAYDIPMVENVPLARRLYAIAKPGDVVPQETYVALAHIVAAITRQSTRSTIPS